MTESADPVAADLVQEAADLARAFDNPEALAAKLRDYLVEHHGPDVAPLYFITAKGNRDKGIAWTVYRRSGFDLDAVIGQQYAGIEIAHAIGPADWHLSIGVGAVTPIANPGTFEAMVSFKVKL